MNTLHINPVTYCDIEEKLGLLTNAGYEKLLDELQAIAASRLNAGMDGHIDLRKVIKLLKIIKVERNDDWGNTLVIDDYDELNKLVFDNGSNTDEIRDWLLKNMLVEVAGAMDEGYRYGLEDLEETKLLKDLLFYVTTLTIRFK